MGIRTQGYWLRQAEAVRRQSIACTAHAVSIAMAEKDSRQTALDALELTETAENRKKQMSESWWGLNKFANQLAKVPRGGKGV